MEENLKLKSILILGGNVKVPNGFSHAYADSKEDGTGSFMLGFGSARIDKTYSVKDGEFELVGNPGAYSLKHEGKSFIEKVEIIRKYCHSPDQANVNLGKFESPDDLKDYLDGLVSTGTVKGISVSRGKNTTLGECIEAVGTMHGTYPDLPIGLSYGVCSKQDMLKLKDCGVNEFKISLGSTADRIFNVLMPTQNKEQIMKCLEDAVDVFGKGRVHTTLFVGLGETDAEIEKSITDVSRMGVLTDLKVKKITSANREKFESELGDIKPLSAERLAAMGKKLKDTEKKFGLDRYVPNTLCLACRGCNLVPFKEY